MASIRYVVLIFVLSLLQLAGLVATLDKYSSCIADHLNLNTSGCVQESDCLYIGLSDTLHCSSETVSLSEDSCMTYDDTTGLVEVGKCIYNKHGTSVFAELRFAELPANTSEINTYMCGRFKRTGTLCGKCKEGFYPLAYSFDMSCVKCPNGRSNWWKYLLAAYLPITGLFLLILMFKIDITSSYMQGFVWYSQQVSAPILSRTIVAYISVSPLPAFNFYRIIASVCGMWNLDFLRFYNLGICLEITPLQNVALDLAVAVYPIILIVFTCIIVRLCDVFKPSRTFLCINLSITVTLTTFFLLSNMRFLTISYDLLAPFKVYQINSTGHLTYSWRLYYDPTLPYFGETHLPYGIAGVIIAVLLVVLPLLLLILYPFRWFQKFLNLFPFRWYILHTFMDIFQGCYKDGTEDTGDYRWFSSVFFIMRVYLVLITFYVSIEFGIYFSIVGIVLTAIFLVHFQPYKDSIKNCDSLSILFLSMHGACTYGTGLEIHTQGFFSTLNFVILCATVGLSHAFIIFYWKKNFALELLMRIKARLTGYSII